MKTATFVKKAAMILVWLDWFFVFLFVGAFVYLFSVPFQSDGSFHNQLWAAIVLGGSTFFLLLMFYLNGLLLRLLMNKSPENSKAKNSAPLNDGEET